MIDNDYSVKEFWKYVFSEYIIQLTRIPNLKPNLTMVVICIHNLFTTRLKQNSLKDALLLKPDMKTDEIRTIAKAYEI